MAGRKWGFWSCITRSLLGIRILILFNAFHPSLMIQQKLWWDRNSTSEWALMKTKVHSEIFEIMQCKRFFRRVIDDVGNFLPKVWRTPSAKFLYRFYHLLLTFYQMQCNNNQAIIFWDWSGVLKWSLRTVWCACYWRQRLATSNSLALKLWNQSTHCWWLRPDFAGPWTMKLRLIKWKGVKGRVERRETVFSLRQG